MKKTIKFLTIFFLALAIQIGQGFFAQNENAARADFSFRDMELSFVQISDTHISDREDTSYKVLSSSKALLEDAIKQTNDIKMLDFVMFTGDMTDEPLKKSYKDFFTLLTKLKYPPLMTFGNHDARQIQTPDKNDTTAKNYLSKDEALNIIRKCNPYYMFEKSWYAFSPKKDYRVIVLDTTVNEVITANGTLTAQQAEFLKGELEANQDKVILIFQHHPVIEPFKSEHHRIINNETYLNIIKQYKKTPIAIFSGHYHAAKIARQGNIIHVSTPSLVTYPNAFRYVNITNYKDRTIFNIKYMETRLEEVQKSSKLNAIASATLRGLPNDHNVIITIRKNKSYDNELKEEKPKTIKEDKVLQKEVEKAQKETERAKKAEEKAAYKADKETLKTEKKVSKENKKALKEEFETKKAEEKASNDTKKAKEAALKKIQKQAEKELKTKEAEARKTKRQTELKAKKEAKNAAKKTKESSKKVKEKASKTEKKNARN